MKKQFMRGVIAVCSVVLLLAIYAPASAQANKVIKLRYSSFWPPSHKISKLGEEWCKEVEKRTNGRIKVSYFPGGVLTPPMQTYDSVVKGIADIGQTLMAYSPGRFPLTEVLYLPLGFTSGYQATKLANAYYKRFQPKEFADTKIMYVHGSPPAIFHTKKVISKTEDMKGLRIKANAENAEIPYVVGAVPVTMPISEAYDAIAKGMVDGILLPMETLKGWRFADVLKSSLLNFAFSYTTAMYVTMNKEKWESISKEDQKTIERINEEFIERQAKLWNEVDKDGIEYAKSKGMTLVAVSKEEQAKWAAKTKPILEKYVKDRKAQGLPGEEALKFCLDYLRANP
jgi:TRAP-type C4-dicarboxylate transport system substrate-binding protein